MLEITAAQMRREHTTNWSLVGCVVGMSTNVAIHRTYIQARATADAGQHFPLFCICKQAAAAVVQKDDVKFFWAVGFSGASWPANQSAVRGDRLACTRGSQHRPQGSQVLKSRDDL